MTTERVTTSYEVHKFTDKITTSEGVVKGTDEVHKHTENITTNEEVEKGTENLIDMKEAVIKILRKDSYKFEGKSKVSTGWFNIDHDFLKRKSSTPESDFCKKFMRIILKV